MARPRSPDILEHLARAAMRLFARQGYEGTRMSEIARESGVSPGTLYNYVEGKRALFYLLVDWGMGDGPPPLPDRLPLPTPTEGRLLERLEEKVGEDFRLERLDRALGSEEPPPAAAEVREILAEFYDRTEETRRPADVLERSAPELPEELGAFFQRVRRSVFDRFARYLRARTRSRRLREIGPPGVVARLLVETVTYAARHRHRDPTAPPDEDGTYRSATIGLWVGALATAEAGVDDA